MVNTAWHLGRTFRDFHPDLAIQHGVAGAFSGGPDLTEVVEVVEDCYAELGADSPEGFISLEGMGLGHFAVGGTTYYNCMAQPRPPVEGMRACKGVTVNRVSGRADAILALQQIWNPAVETMEGAAFFQACTIEGIPFRAFRAISNRVEPRNRAGWKLAEAVETAQLFLISALEKLQRKEIAL